MEGWELSYLLNLRRLTEGMREVLREACMEEVLEMGTNLVRELLR